MAVSKKSKPSYFYAIVGISLVLFLLGTLGWLLLNGRALSGKFKENLEVNVNLHDNTRPQMAQQLKAVLDKQPWVKRSRYVSKEDALRESAAFEGEQAEVALGFNPLWPQLVLNVHNEYVNPDSLTKIKAFLMQSNIVHDVDYPQRIASSLDKNFRRIGLILGAISLLLLGTVIILIDNTVRLAMFSNRFLIKTMQMVGATRRFISDPFDRRAILNGIISAAIAVAGLWGVITFAESYLPEIKDLADPASMTMLIGAMVVVGVLVSLLSTHRSVVKYLKVRLDDLY